MGKRSPICHVEWRSRNVSRLQAFYKAVFRWKFNEEMPGYALAATGTKGVGVGFMQIEGNAPIQPGVVSFVSSEDLAESEAAIREAGGQIQASSQAVPGWGRFSIFTDPDGNQLALWQTEDAVRKEEKRAAKAHKRAEAERERAAKTASEPDKEAKKARKKEEKRAAKAAKKAAKAGKPNGDGKPGKKDAKPAKDKKKGAAREDGAKAER